MLLATIIVVLALGNAVLNGQEIKWDNTLGRTAIRIICDTPNVPIYLDGHFIGKSPLKDVIDVFDGWHRVSCFPEQPVSSEPDRQPAGRRVRDIIRMGQQDVLVEKGEIVEVVISYQGIEKDVEEFEKKIKSGQWVGFSMFLIVILILSWIA